MTLTGYEILIHTSVKKGSARWYGMVIHEMTHWDQFVKSWGLHNILRLFSKKYLLKAEVEAYANQWVYLWKEGASTSHLDKFAEWVATIYGLDITKEEARVLILAKAHAV